MKKIIPAVFPSGPFLARLLTLTVSVLPPAFSYSQNVVDVVRLEDRIDYHKKIPRKITESHWKDIRTEYPYRKYIFTYDPDGVLLSEETFNETGARVTKDTYIREHFSKKVISVIMEWQNRYTSTWRQRWYQYDSSRCVNGTIDKNAAGVIIASSFIKVNENCQPLEVSRFKENGELWQKEIAEYFEDKNMIVTKVLDGDNNIMSVDSFAIKSSDGIIDSALKKEYNEHQDIVRVVMQNADGLILGNEFDYKYDPTGNWIEKNIYFIKEKKKGKMSKSKVFAVTRAIEYKWDQNTPGKTQAGRK